MWFFSLTGMEIELEDIQDMISWIGGNGKI